MTGRTDDSGRPDYEDDADVDDKQALSRAEGGDPQADMPDRHSTTGSTPSEDFVGRVAGDDGGYEGETGAERRAAAAEADRGEGG